MSYELTIWNETTAGKLDGGSVVEFLTECITVRELIRERVYHEVPDVHTVEKSVRSKYLIQPEHREAILNDLSTSRARKAIDWKKQFEQACEAFENKGFLILVDDRQLDSLDERIKIKPGVEVTFVKLVPLAGG